MKGYTGRPHVGDVVLRFQFGEISVRQCCCSVGVASVPTYLLPLDNNLTKFRLVLADPPASVTQRYNKLSSHYITKIEETSEASVLTERPIPYITVHFRRYSTHYIVQVFVPNTITCFVPYSSFYICPSMIQARATLCISSLIAMVLQYGNTVQGMPKVGYIKSIDYWNIGCILFIFASLIEFSALCYLTKQKKSNRDLLKVDKFCRFAYPVLFVAFAFFYFLLSM